MDFWSKLSNLFRGVGKFWNHQQEYDSGLSNFNWNASWKIPCLSATYHPGRLKLIAGLFPTNFNSDDQRPVWLRFRVSLSFVQTRQCFFTPTQSFYFLKQMYAGVVFSSWCLCVSMSTVNGCGLYFFWKCTCMMKTHSNDPSHNPQAHRRASASTGPLRRVRMQCVKPNVTKP